MLHAAFKYLKEKAGVKAFLDALKQLLSSTMRLSFQFVIFGEVHIALLNGKLVL